MPSGPRQCNFVMFCLIFLELIFPKPIRVELTSIRNHSEGHYSMVMKTSATESIDHIKIIFLLFLNPTMAY